MPSIELISITAQPQPGEFSLDARGTQNQNPAQPKVLQVQLAVIGQPTSGPVFLDGSGGRPLVATVPVPAELGLDGAEQKARAILKNYFQALADLQA